jgi:catechol 2,3-dioxygenase
MSGNATREYGVAPSGYRLPDATRLGKVTLQVSDLERSLAYYEGVLGFRVLDRGDGRASLGAHGAPAALVELRERRGAAPVPRGGRLGLYHFAILLPDRPSLGRFVRHLSDIGARAGASDNKVSEAIYLQDPDGLGIEVYADRPRASWEYEGGQIVMATEPLNLASLVAAGGDEPWSGLPAGTTVGHVHLHVGDLREASDFYHAGLGLDRVVWNYPGALFLSAGGYHHHQGLNTWAAGASPAGEEDARLLEWEVLLPDPAEVESAAASLERSGRAVERGAGGWRATDPWGTTLWVATGDAA